MKYQVRVGLIMAMAARQASVISAQGSPGPALGYAVAIMSQIGRYGAFTVTLLNNPRERRVLGAHCMFF